MPKITTYLFLVFCTVVFAESPSSLRDRFYQIENIATSKTTSFSRSADWDPGEGITLEVSGIEKYDEKRLIICLRNGDVLILNNPDTAAKSQPDFTLFATGLHEPLGIAKRGDSFFLAQRSEVTELKDLDGDDQADLYQRFARPWEITGNYHEYAYGPAIDKKGNLWFTTNLGMGKLSKPNTPFRGWGMMVDTQGKTHYIGAGMRSPCGVGSNPEGDIFFTDQQGNYIPTNTLHHLRPDAFFGHPTGLNSVHLTKTKLVNPKKIPNKIPYPEAIQKIPGLVSPTIWFPYLKMGRSTTDIQYDSTKGSFGPFKNQLFVGEFTHSAIQRVFLEKVNGEYQGACFPFLKGFPAAVVRMKFGNDGAMYVGMTNRGWNSTGGASFGLHRVTWNGKTPFEIQKMEVLSDGFRLTFTKDLNKTSALDKSNYHMKHYTYEYSSAYGGEEILKSDNQITNVRWINSKCVELEVDQLKQYYVHELVCHGVLDSDQQKLIHPDAYYTLNQIP